MYMHFYLFIGTFIVLLTLLFIYFVAVKAIEDAIKSKDLESKRTKRAKSFKYPCLGNPFLEFLQEAPITDEGEGASQPIGAVNLKALFSRPNGI